MVSTTDHPRIELPLPGDPVRRKLMRVVRPGLERVLKLDDLNRIHDAAMTRAPGADVHAALLDAMGIRVEVDEAELARIPVEGPVVVVSNHPFGGIEGIALAHLLNRARPDARLMANHLLGLVPVLKDQFFFVDPFGGPEAVRRNLKVIREVIGWVRGGHVLGVFPAGEVSHVRFRDGGIVDPPWSPTIARIIRRTGATVVPLYFHGRNSVPFQLLGMVHPRLRTLMLPRELVARERTTLRAVVGQPVPPERLERIEADEELLDHLRARTYLLRGRIEQRDAIGRVGPRQETIAPAASDAAIRAEMDALPPESVLVRHGQFRIHMVDGTTMPAVMDEIGRTREVTFREVGEGTGRSRDLDSYDRHYHQLILWDEQAGRIAGGYRVGVTSEIVPARGIDGLYTRSLFSFQQSLLDQITPALELGRSYVTPEYQRTYAPLMLLWKAIGAYVVRHPENRHLFGPVSISNEYHSTSRTLLIAFLQATRFLEPLGRLIKPKRPVRVQRGRGSRRITAAVARDLEDVETIVRDIELDRRSVPVLLRQYLKLEGKLLAFNVDPDFGDVVDGLMLIDLCDVDPRVLRHYMGKDGAASFLAYHGRGAGDREG
jgi:putative hemolysin